MKKALSMLLAALLVAGTTTVVMANDEVNLTADGTAMIGDMPLMTGTPEDAFDNDPSTYADFGVDGPEDYWIGLELPAPAVLTWVQMWAPDYDGDGVVERVHCLYGMIVEGSNDGENWDYILQLGDVYSEYEEYAWDMEDGLADYFDEEPFDGESDYDDDATDPVAYKYYRFYNDTKGIAIWGDIQIWGYYIEQEPEQPDYLIGDVDLDGVVDINDAMYLFQYSMLPDLFTMEYQGNLDVDFDDQIDINDAMYLFQYSMLPDMFPIEW